MFKILIIDDSVLMRTVLRGQLEEEGFGVEEFLPASVLELVARIQTAPPDLVISDYNMPIVDGQEVAKTVRRTNPKIPVIILTANRDAAREAQLMAAGVRKILHKPLSGSALIEAVGRVMATL